MINCSNVNHKLSYGLIQYKAPYQQTVVISKNFNKGDPMCNVINRVWFVVATPIFSNMQIW